MHDPLYGYAGSHTIDQHNSLLYWLDTTVHDSKDCKNGNQKYCSLLIIDISDILNYKVLKQILIDRNEKELIDFSDGFAMFVIGNNIHFISIQGIPRHYIFDIKLEKLKLINETIHLDRVPKYSIDDIWNVLKKDSVIDMRDSQYGKFYSATIIDVQEMREADNNREIKNICVHYQGYSSKFDEWIEVNKENTICNCNGLCKYRFYRTTKKITNDSRINFDESNANLHRIAYGSTQIELSK